MAGIAYPMWWGHRSATVGHELLRRALQRSTGRAASRSTAASCSGTRGYGAGPATASRGGTSAGSLSAGTATTRHPAVLEIPAIGLEAPVLQGVTDAVFAVAVGHDPASSWPGTHGESLLLAHDVSYFSHIDQARTGDTVIWIDGCHEDIFRVVRHEVTQPGAPISLPSSGNGLALITCFPTDALFWTSQRYVVETALVGQRRIPSGSASVRGTPTLRLGIPAAPALRAEAESLAHSSVLEGHLSVSGSPTRSFRQGPEPLAAANLALVDYAAAEEAALASDGASWARLALRGVPLPLAWSLRYATDITLTVENGHVVRAVLSSPAATVILVVRHATLYVASVATAT